MMLSEDDGTRLTDGMVDDTSQIIEGVLMNLREVVKAYPGVVGNGYWVMAMAMLRVVERRCKDGTV